MARRRRRPPPRLLQDDLRHDLAASVRRLPPPAGHALPGLRLLQGRQDKERARVREVDDVLDRLRNVLGAGDVHRHICRILVRKQFLFATVYFIFAIFSMGRKEGSIFPRKIFFAQHHSRGVNSFSSLTFTQFESHDVVRIISLPIGEITIQESFPPSAAPLLPLLPPASPASPPSSPSPSSS